MNDAMTRIIELADYGYYCSQILIQMDMERLGKTNPELVKAAGGLGHGCGFFGGSCGALSGGACILAMHAGKNGDEEPESEKLVLMQSEFGEWFKDRFGGKYGGINCENISGDMIGTPKGRERCGMLVWETHNKLLKILSDHGHHPDRPA